MDLSSNESYRTFRDDDEGFDSRPSLLLYNLLVILTITIATVTTEKALKMTANMLYTQGLFLVRLLHHVGFKNHLLYHHTLM